MARPRGKKLHAEAFRYVLRKEGLSVADVAKRTGIGESTLYGLLADDQRASDKLIRTLTDNLALGNDSVLFPELAGFDGRERIKANA